MILDVNTKEIFISRDVIFHELIFLFHTTPINPNQHSPPLPNNSITNLLNTPSSPAIPTNTPFVPFETTSPSSPLPNSLSSHVSNPPFNEPFLHSPSTTSPPSSNESPISHQPSSPRRSASKTHPPSYLFDYQYKLPLIKSAKLNSLPLAHILSKLVSPMLKFLHLITTSLLSHLMKNQPASTKPVSINVGAMQCNAKLRPYSQIRLGMLFPPPHMFIQLVASGSIKSSG